MNPWEKAFYALFWAAAGLVLLYVVIRASGLFGLIGLISVAVWVAQRLQRMRP